MAFTPQEINDLVSKYNSHLKKLKFEVQKTNEIIAELKKLKPEASSLKRATTSKVKSKPGRKPGRPAKAKKEETPVKAKKKPGRPAKAKTASTGTATAEKRKPGRPAKAKTAATASGAKKKPGRPAKAKPATTSAATTEKRKPGRPAKAKTAAVKAPKVKAVKAPKVKKVKTPKVKKESTGYKLSNWDTFILDKLKSAEKVLLKPQIIEAVVKEAKELTKGLKQPQIEAKISSSIHKLANKRDELIKTAYQGRGFAYALKSWTNEKGKVEDKYTS